MAIRAKLFTCPFLYFFFVITIHLLIHIHMRVCLFLSTKQMDIYNKGIFFFLDYKQKKISFYHVLPWFYFVLYDNN